MMRFSISMNISRDGTYAEDRKCIKEKISHEEEFDFDCYTGASDC